MGQQDGRKNPSRFVRRETAHQGRGDGHQKEGSRQSRFAAMLIPNVPDQHATDRTHQKGASENGKRFDQVTVLRPFWFGGKENLGNNIYSSNNG
jgi:hypothetical protein